ncbi:MAG: V-type ATP synthase subunit B, partial [Deltaproteobacteria bacterium]|nr:V-type ATP synthase subunit B [Deltaproteobacteria bacterium]
MKLTKNQYATIKKVTGPLIFVEGLKGVSFSELCTIKLRDGETRLGQVLKLHDDQAVIQVLEGTSGIDIKDSSVTPHGEVAKIGLSEDVLGRVFNGMGKPIDGLPPILPTVRMDINGSPINPVARERPFNFIETGISAIDGLNTLVRGQKLPVFSTAGLPANKLVMQILKNSRVPDDEEFYIVLGAMGITSREAFFFADELEASGMKHRTVSYINLASDPAVERLFTPRIALTTSEYLAFEKGCHVLLLITDMTAYCEALREIAGAREE